MKAEGSVLARGWERLRTVPGLGRDVIIVTVMAVLGVAAGGAVLSQTTFVSPLDDQFAFAAEFDEAPGTNPQTTHIVTIAGVEVGNITGSRHTEHGTAEIEMSIDAEHVIYENATAVLRSTGPLNQMYIEINPGDSPAEPLPANGVIPRGQTDRPIQPEEVLEHLDERTRNAMTAMLVESDVALARAPEELPGGLRATDDVLTGLRPVVEALRTRRDTLAELTTALSQIAAAAGDDQERLTSLLDASHETLSVLADSDEDLRATLAELPGLSDSLRQAFTATQELTEQLDPTLDNLEEAADALPPALRRMTDTTGAVGEVVDKAQPVVDTAGPVVADLRPLLRYTDTALGDLVPTSGRFDEASAAVVEYRDDLSGFVFNTSSVMSVRDARGPFARGHIVVPLPDGGVLPGMREGHVPPDEGAGRSEGGN